MQKVEFRTLDGRFLSLNANAEFVKSTRQHTLGEGTPTSYVVEISDVFDKLVDTKERCVVIVLPALVSEAIDYSAAPINEQVRTTLEGVPVACALLAKDRVAVNAHALNEAQPLDFGRLTIFWMFKDRVDLCHYPYTEETEERLWLASSVADGHRREVDRNANGKADEVTGADSGVIEVLSYFTVVQTTG
ncbi:hypothetical protein E2553_35130 [Paraburkholderia dipogonis]|uniref:Uncharacterized protein n=1 Tax=Paraburkholderia dipogonis TaxID=1211383 RepID=A0A4Y8MWF9_9BURK|nr:hypothetical protein [Paraburkholderia dipogonis]TFE41876.1 hypothetical protein E2553_35130 [Paraburkholderia dipogonis]